jgi:hypothetical protein
MRRLLIFAPLVVNLIACAAFLIVRPEATSLIEERERAEQNGTLSLSSSDPYMLIAGRPLRQWNEWHGGESAWVKVIEVANGPAVFAAKRFGDRWSAQHVFDGQPAYGRQSWVRAYFFLIVSSVQWLLIGLALARLTRPRRAETTSEPVEAKR